MKNLKRNFAILFLFFTMPFFGSEKNDSLYTIEIDGQVLLPKSENTTSYKIELFRDNILIDSIEVRDSEHFLLKFKKDTWHTVRIVKPGYITVLININTKLPSNNTGFYSLHFDTELVPACSSGFIYGEVGFRIAKIIFDKNNVTFKYNEMI